MGYYRRHSRLFRYAGPAFLCLFIGLGTGLLNVYADEVILSNGDRVSGRLISLSPKTICISTPHSGIIETDREHLLQLKTDNPVMVKLLSGERVIGRIRSAEGEGIVIHSTVLGECVLSLTAVASMEPCLPHENIHRDISRAGAREIFDVAGSNPSRSANEQNELSAQLQEFRGKGADTVKPPGDADEKPAQAAAQPRSIGQRPQEEEDIRRIFLRQSSVLLRPGEKEFEVRFDYLANQLPAAVYNARFRHFQLPLGFRIGIMEGLEGSVSIPFTHAEQEIFLFPGSVTRKTTGIGDTSLGINYEIFRETARRPDITTTLRIRAPTGDEPDEEGLSTGSGHWAGSLGLQFIKTTDPVVLFWGIRYTHEFPATHFFNDGVYEVRPGDTVDYNFGFGFAVNGYVSLSAQVLGAYQWETSVDGHRLTGTSGEPVSLRSALTYRVSRETYIEPSLTMGLNDETPDFILGIAATRRFGN